jgi:NADH-quinone oxidoreductase subunit N
MTQTDLIAILPLLVLIGWAMVVMLADLWIPANRKGITGLLAAAGLAAALGLTVARWSLLRNATTAFYGMFVLDGFSLFVDILVLATGLVTIGLAYDYMKRIDLHGGTFYLLLMFSVAGMMVMAHANDLILVFLALEMLSIPLYVMAGLARGNKRSEEAALKYFLLGAFASGFVLYGVAMIFGATARTDLPGIMAAATGEPILAPLFLVGAVMLIVGFGFKVAAVPFQWWTPDVYQGAPTPVTAFMSVAVKVAGFAALLRVFLTAFPSLAGQLTPFFYGMAVLTMIIGNVVAVAQTNIKRLLAYSSIAQAGYLLMAFVPFGVREVTSDLVASALFFLAAYGLASIGMWSVVIALEEKEGKGLEIADFTGLGRKYPWLGAAVTVFMLSFTGVPMTLGFWGKFFLFRTVITGGYLELALIGLVLSIISAYYYLRIVVVMFMKEGESTPKLEPWIIAVAGVTAVALVVLSFVPGGLLDAASHALLLLQ